MRISTLGGLFVILGGKRIAFSTRKAEALLVYLACHRRELPREQLATLLWEEQSQTQALTSLRAALVNLRKYLGDNLLSTRTSIGLKSGDIWLDVEELQQRLQAGETSAGVALFQGEFLEGFYLKGSAGFENWLVVERERIRRLVQDALHELVSRSLAQQHLESGITYAQRLLQLDLLDEAAQRQMMTLLAYSGQRTVALNVYENSRQLLLDELGIEPEEATNRLYAQIKAGQLDHPQAGTPGVPVVQVPPPAFIEDTQERYSHTPVVARQAEISKLLSYLSRVEKGQGQVVFVTGSAGQGKTTLLNEFARQAMVKQPNLLVASGICNHIAGIGDSYLPFRDVLAMLSGDVESRWASGAISREHAMRLWKAMAFIVQALMEHGDQLLEILVPVSGLVSRVTSAGYQGAGWLKKLEERVDQQKTRQEEINQGHLFEQLTNVLRSLSKTQPLLITLDDFQWADFASTSLLFHLGRRISGSQVMIVCAYRPEEITIQRGGERHPLEKVIAEFRRQFGDIWIELDNAAETSGREFVDAILDSEPNALDDGFRTTLLAHTGGHPLFTVELLREMQLRGDLIQFEGRWIPGKNLIWENLPARADAVIAERIARLDVGLQDILTAACVEGEEFTAQVIARMRDIEVRKLVSRISQELIKLHRLLKPGTIGQVGKNRLFGYRFYHFFFQRHLYDRLDVIERELLHEQVARALEELYGEQVDKIAPKLAYHYSRSGDQEKARHYLARAGLAAQEMYANQQAIEFYTQALDLIPVGETASRFELLMRRENVYSLQGNRDAQARDLASLEALASDIGEPARIIDVSLRKAGFAMFTSDYQAATEASNQAIEYARRLGDVEREASGQLALGHALIFQGDYELSFAHLNAALEMANALSLHQLAADCNKRLGLLKHMQEDDQAAKEYWKEAADIYSRLGNRLGQAYILNSLGIINQAFWNLQEAIDEYTLSLKMFREIGETVGEAFALNNLGLIATHQGDYAQAQFFYESALSIFRQVDHPLGRAVTLNNLGEVFCYLEDYRRGKDYYRQALDVFMESGNRPNESYALTGLGDTAFGLGELEEAEDYYRQAISLDQEFGQETHLIESRAGLARVALAQGERDEARSQVSAILNFLDEGHFLLSRLSPFRVYQTCYQVLQACHDPKADEVLESAYRLLQDWAAKITDPAAHRSFLENIPWNREIAKAFAEHS